MHVSKAVFRKPLFFRPRSHGLVAINSRDASGRSFQPIAGRRVNEDDSDRIGLALCVPLRYRPASFKMCLFTLAGSDSNRLIFTPSIANEAFTVVINNTSKLDRVLTFFTSHFVSVVAIMVLPLFLGCGVHSNNLNASGTRYFQRGDHVTAIKKFEDAVAVNPKDADSYYNLGSVYHHLANKTGDPTHAGQAEAYYNQCLDNDPNHVDCHRGLAVHLTQQGRGHQGFRLVQGFKQRCPDNADASVELARLHQEAGNSKAAEEHLLDAIANDTTHPRARVALGKLHEERGDYGQAIANYHVALSRNGAQPDLHARVAALKGEGSSSTPLLSDTPLTKVVTAPDGNMRY